MKQTCPICNKTYETILERKTQLPIQREHPNAPAWQREQLITGICCEKCWREYLGIGTDEIFGEEEG